MKNLSKKTVVVTGANGLIGNALVGSLIVKKCKIIAVDKVFDNSNIKQRYVEEKNYENLICYGVDILDELHFSKIIYDSIKKLGPIHGLVNCAAIDFLPESNSSNSVEELDINQFQEIMNINVNGQVLCSKVVGKTMIESETKGSIINLSSIYGKVSPKQEIYNHIKTDEGEYKKPLVYSVSKSALTNMAKYLATYWGENEIRVNNVVFGGIFNNQDEIFVENYSKNVPLKRMANLEESIDPILFLLRDSSSYITGTDLIVDGGWTAW